MVNDWCIVLMTDAPLLEQRTTASCDVSRAVSRSQSEQSPTDEVKQDP